MLQAAYFTEAKEAQALSVALEGSKQFLSGKRYFYEENVILYWNFANVTTAKAQCTINGYCLPGNCLHAYGHCLRFP